MLKTGVWSFGVLSLLTPENTYLDVFVHGVIPLLMIMKDKKKTLSNYVTPFSFSGRRRHENPLQINANASVTNTGNRHGVLFDIWELLRKRDKFLFL